MKHRPLLQHKRHVFTTRPNNISELNLYMRSLPGDVRCKLISAQNDSLTITARALEQTTEAFPLAHTPRNQEKREFVWVYSEYGCDRIKRLPKALSLGFLD